MTLGIDSAKVMRGGFASRSSESEQRSEFMRPTCADPLHARGVSRSCMLKNAATFVIWPVSISWARVRGRHGVMGASKNVANGCRLAEGRRALPLATRDSANSVCGQASVKMHVISAQRHNSASDVEIELRTSSSHLQRRQLHRRAHA